MWQIHANAEVTALLTPGVSGPLGASGLSAYSAPRTGMASVHVTYDTAIIRMAPGGYVKLQIMSATLLIGMCD